MPGGTVRPSALAVLRLMISLYLVGCWTGRSDGLAPPENAVDIGCGLRKQGEGLVGEARAIEELVAYLKPEGTEACFDNGFRAIVVKEAVGDRSPSAHEANLFDIDARYGDVVSLEQALDYLVSLRGAASKP